MRSSVLETSIGDTLMKRLGLLVVMWALSCSASEALGQGTWAERLGFPAGKRVVVLHANDLGIDYEFNRPAEAGLESGAITSASVLAAGPWFEECVTWAEAHPGMDLGVTLSFVSPSDALCWGPVASRDEVPSLLTMDGDFAKTVTQFATRADAEQVRREAVAQIERARLAGIKPTHLHPHLGAILSRPDLVEVYLQLAEELWIPAVMVEMTPEVIERFRAKGLIIPDDLSEVVSKYRLPKLDEVQILPPSDSYEAKREAFFQLIRELPPGLTQVFLNPADDTPGLRRMTNKWQDRVWEAQLVADPAVKDFLKEQEIVLTNWREIMQRFEASTADPQEDGQE
jgi:predicted glycoside hydrolase/deacetylase ChbG (UPF0249 family)